MMFKKKMSIAVAVAMAFGTMAHAQNDSAITDKAVTTTSATSASSTTKTKKASSTTKRVRGTAYVRILHAIPDAPAVDVYADGQKVLTSAAFKSLSDYMPVPSGKRTAKLSTSGKSDSLLSGAVTLSKDKFFTLIAYGSVAKPVFMLMNESTGKDMPGKARVYVAHLAPNAPASTLR